MVKELEKGKQKWKKKERENVKMSPFDKTNK